MTVMNCWFVKYEAMYMYCYVLYMYCYVCTHTRTHAHTHTHTHTEVMSCLQVIGKQTFGLFYLYFYIGHTDA